METLNKALEYWNALPLGVQTLICVYIYVASVIQALKKMYISGVTPKAKRVRCMWFTATIVGAMSAVIGWALIPETAVIYWVFVGGTAGTASMMIHYAVFKAVVPWIINKIKK